MRVRFWGTRGSLPVPGPDTIRYGGNTSCVEVESDSGTLVVIDCGTGVRRLGSALAAEDPAARAGAILISHTHWDHIQGFPFFAPLFVPGSEWDVYGPRGLGESLRDTLAGQMQYTYFPITLDAMGAEIRYHSLVEGSFRIGDVQVRTRYLNHPALTLGYRLEADGASVAYACDHEPFQREAARGDVELGGKDRAHVDFVRGVDLLIHDAQFTAEEYSSRVGWGHSSVEYALRVADEGQVGSLAFTHHDPARSDDELDAMVESLRTQAVEGGYAGEIRAAREGDVLELRREEDATPGAAVGISGEAPEDSALRVDRSVEGHRIALALPPSPEARTIEEVAEQDGVEMVRLPSDVGTSELQGLDASLVIVPGDAEGLATAAALGELGEDWARDATVVAVADHLSEDERVDDWLVRPFSPEYARTRIRSWLLRIPVRWARAPAAPDEAARLEALRDLAVLDTEAEERFDRITRIAAALIGAPVSLISLVDENRQWFKSAQGLDASETSRDFSFCAHAILGDGTFVVSDATEDDRFADNPLVTGPEQIRFYAGHPLTSPDGHRVGSLCVIDSRARELTPRDRQVLEDLAHLAEEELARTAG